MGSVLVEKVSQRIIGHGIVLDCGSRRGLMGSLGCGLHYTLDAGRRHQKAYAPLWIGLIQALLQQEVQ